MARTVNPAVLSRTRPVSNRRQALRSATHEAHVSLEAATSRRGYFETRANYGEWLQRMHAFHGAIERQVDGIDSLGNTVSTRRGNPVNAGCRDLIEADLADLGLKPMSPVASGGELPRLGATGAAGVLAIRYVVEGSNLGARILFRLASELGFTEHWGARYLADCASRTSDWREYLVELEAHSGSATDDAHMCDVAKRTFELARLVMDQAP